MSFLFPGMLVNLVQFDKISKDSENSSEKESVFNNLILKIRAARCFTHCEACNYDLFSHGLHFIKSFSLTHIFYRTYFSIKPQNQNDNCMFYLQLDVIINELFAFLLDCIVFNSSNVYYCFNYFCENVKVVLEYMKCKHFCGFLSLSWLWSCPLC